MADDSQPIKYVYVDSTNRDSNIFPNGNSYTLHLTNPLHSVIQVDLVAAKVPNTVYNLTNGSNVLVFTNMTDALAPITSNISIPTGYYSAYGLSQALVNSSGLIFCMDFNQDEGRYIFSSNVQFNLQGTTSEIRTLLGLDSGTLISFYSSSSLIYANDSNYTGQWLYKSSNIINLTVNEYVFLDIEELRTTSVLDAKKLVGGTTEGSSIRNSFGMIPMDVPSGVVKNYKEGADYRQYIMFTSPIPKISRLTVRWTDSQGRPVNFQGFDNNAFTLRFHCEYRKPLPPPQPLQDVELKRIIEAMTIALPPPPEKKTKFKIPWVLIFLVLVICFAIYKTFGPKPAPVVQAPTGFGPGQVARA